MSTQHLYQPKHRVSCLSSYTDPDCYSSRPSSIPSINIEPALYILFNIRPTPHSSTRAASRDNTWIRRHCRTSPAAPIPTGRAGLKTKPGHERSLYIFPSSENHTCVHPFFFALENKDATPSRAKQPWWPAAQMADAAPTVVLAARMMDAALPALAFDVPSSHPLVAPGAVGKLNNPRGRPPCWNLGIISRSLARLHNVARVDAAPSVSNHRHPPPGTPAAARIRGDRKARARPEHKRTNKQGARREPPPTTTRLHHSTPGRVKKKKGPRL